MDEKQAQYQASIIIREMFEARGYTSVKDKNEKGVIQAKQGELKIWYFVVPCQKLNREQLDNYFNQIRKNGIKYGIIPYYEKTNNIDSVIDTIETSGYTFELWDIRRLQFNPLKHSLVPEHSVVDTSEIAEIRMDKNKLPVISRHDPISRFLNFKKGNIIRVKRKNVIIFRIVN